jgi:hypothetical protein
MAAQHLTSGRAVGVDLWRTIDQSGNSAEATQRNAVAEGVADRIELHTGDMTALPFEDNSFDVVVSSLAIHNISGRAGREKAIDEAEAEMGFYENDGIELNDVLREFVLLSLPIKRVCSDDCKGICPVCGQNRNQSECKCQAVGSDDRWAALKEFK